MADFDVAVIGAGVIGLAVAREAQAAGYRTLVIERRERAGTEQSTHNSGVIHSGLPFYFTGAVDGHETLRVRLCREGNPGLYEFCEANQVPYRRTGKLLIADSPEAEGTLARYESLAREVGVHAERLTAAELQQREPALRGSSALFLPSAGVLDAGRYVEALRAQAKERNVELVFCMAVTRIRDAEDGVRLTVESHDVPDETSARIVVNAAGLNADAIAALHGLEYGEGSRFYRGEYARFDRTRRPELGFNGTNAYAAGRMEAGVRPHVIAQLDEGGRVADEALIGPFWTRASGAADMWPTRTMDEYATAAGGIFPGLRTDDLHPAFSGIKRVSENPDFSIRRVRNVVHLQNMNSPALTASLAIGRHVRGLFEGSF